MHDKKIQTAFISVFTKDGLLPILQELHALGVHIYSTGGTQKFIEDRGFAVETVEDLTGYPSILDGRVKTLHPKVFGGILARGDEAHQAQLAEYDIPAFDLVIVDLYPFEETVARTQEEATIIEKIDIGGISLIRAAAKNYREVAVIASRSQYSDLLEKLRTTKGQLDLEQRRAFAAHAFAVSSQYDVAIFNYFNRAANLPVFKQSEHVATSLRYGENPHQKGVFFGDLTTAFDQINGKALSYNNLVDVDAAFQLIKEYWSVSPTIAILKHTNPCGIASRPSVSEAWDAALAGDPISAFGGIIASNAEIDLETAEKIDTIFYEVLMAPKFSDDALTLLKKKKKRILLAMKPFQYPKKIFKSLLSGVIMQDTDGQTENPEGLVSVTMESPSEAHIQDLLFANKCVKHLKSNAIALVKGQQLLGMGCGQTSRVDALEQSIAKAQRMGFSLENCVMASDAFFPFPDCVEIAHKAGVKAVIQPGGSVKDQLSIDYCNSVGMAMVFSGFRHFKH